MCNLNIPRTRILCKAEQVTREQTPYTLCQSSLDCSLFPRTLRIESRHLNFNQHRVRPETPDLHASPSRMVFWYPLLEIANYRFLDFLIQLDMMCVDPVDSRPTLSTCVFECFIDVYECLISLLGNEPGDGRSLIVEASYS